MTIDPTPFLSAIVTVGATLVAIIGGLLIAKFVSLDADQRTSRKILKDARDRLDVAQRRAQTAWKAILRWDAEGFFAAPDIIEAVLDQGIVSPDELMRMASWSHDAAELAPFVTEVAEEADVAREAIPPRIGKEIRDLMECLAKFETMTVGEAFRGYPGKEYDVEAIPTAKARERLDVVGLADMTKISVFRLSGEQRLYGFRCGNVFHVVWWDPEHVIWPSRLKHT